jgi:hypothetical protein
MGRGPDPPSKYHLPDGAGSKERRCLRSVLPAAYGQYASLVAPRRLASDILPVARDTPKSFAHIVDSGI